MQIDGQHHFCGAICNLCAEASMIACWPVWNKPVDVFGARAGGLESIDDHVGNHADGVWHFAALHPEITHGAGRGGPP